MKQGFLLLFVCLIVLVGCAKGPRQIIAEPLNKHDRDKDHAYCQQQAERYGVINMDPLMSGSGMEDFPDLQRQTLLYESCMQKKGYRF